MRNNTLITSGDSAGYIRTRYICENAPGCTGKRLDGHTYESYAWGNAAGGRWMAAMRAKTCAKCGGKVVPINLWHPTRQVPDA